MSLFLIAALTLGFAGSLHCIGMCGPLVMIVHGVNSNTGFKWWLQQTIYHSGRLLVYSGFGAIAGIVGKSAIAMGWQQGLAVFSGIMLLIMLLVPLLPIHKIKIGQQLYTKISQYFGKFLKEKTPVKYFALGIINGFLPCGLVYAAMAASVAGGSIAMSMLFMILFGISTSPALFAISGFTKIIRNRINVRWMKYVRLSFGLLAVLFILRGANLGIPYLSPKMKAETCETSCCHR